MPIIDTHQHLWDLDLFHYAWLDSSPTLNRSFGMADYLAAVEGLGVTKTVHVEADVDSLICWRRLSTCCSSPLKRTVLWQVLWRAAGRNMMILNPSLDKIAEDPKLKGIRRVLHTQPDELGRSRRFVGNVRQLAAYGLSFDICVLDRQLPIAINLVRACPDVTFILDHCGVPRVKERVLDPWRTHIVELSSFPNVYCKISGLVAYADPLRWTAEDLRPYVEHVLSSFGWDRVMFGSDWPVCTVSASYQKWVETLASLTEMAGAANQRKLFYENAVRVYRLA
ncbi:MAG: amidohydrolase [Acidobacteria bacterium]|nr:amidohydrolase [Acidobacteriota bacterium]